jgi:hypothetical protein
MSEDDEPATSSSDLSRSGTTARFHLAPFQCSVNGLKFNEPTVQMSSSAVENVAEKAFGFSKCGVGTTLPVHIADTEFVDAIRKTTHAAIVRKIFEDFTSLFSLFEKCTLGPSTESAHAFH